MFRVWLLVGLLLISWPGEALSLAVVQELKRTLSSEKPEDRISGLRSLVAFPGSEALGLAKAMCRHADPLTRAEAVAAVASLDAKEGLAAVKAAAADKDGLVRAAAVSCFARLQGVACIPVLLKVRADKEVRVRRAVVTALADLLQRDGGSQAKPIADALQQTLADTDVQVRLAAIEVAVRLPPDLALPVLLAACRSPCEEIVTKAAAGIQTINGSEKAAELLVAQVLAAPPRERITGLVALSILGHPAGVRAAAVALGQPEPEVRSAALELIAGCSDLVTGDLAKTCEDQALALLGDRDWGVRATAAEALGRLGSARAPGLLIDLLAKTKDPDREAVMTSLRGLSQRTDLVDPRQWAAWWKETHAVFLPSRLPPPAIPSSVDFYEVTDTFEEAVFVIDVSGSMADRGPENGYKTKEDKTKIAGAKRELRQTILKLNGGTRFNIVFFGASIRLWREGPMRATWRTKRAVDRELETVGPNGGTATHAALELALAQPDFDAVFLLSDGMPTVGEVTDPNRILADVARWNRERSQSVRIHAIAFFIEEARDFLSQLAGQNGGQYRFIH